MKKILILFFTFTLSYSFAQTTTNGRGPGNTTTTTTTTDDSKPYGKAIKIDTTRGFVGLGPTPPYLPPPTPLGPTGEGDRKVFFVHGIGGKRDAWGDASEALANPIFNKNGFQAREVTTHKLQYTQTGGIISASYDIRDEINGLVDPELDDYTQNIIIAHSLGGVVSKALIYDQFCADPITPANRKYGGLVTVSSPLNGTYIADNYYDGKFHDFSAYACQELTAGIFENSTAQLLSSLFSIELEAVNDGVCGVVKEILPAFFSKTASPILRNLKIEDNDTLDVVNSCTAPLIEKIAFYGNEPYHEEGKPDQIFWRTTRHFLENPNDQAHWEANNDEPIEMVTDAKNWYAKKVIELDAEILMLENIGIPCNWYQWIANPFGCALFGKRYKKRIKKRNAYRRGLAWFDDANDLWLDLIGALVTEIEVSGYDCHCFIDGELQIYGPVSDPADCGQYEQGPAPDCEAKPRPSVTVTLIEKPSDGVVLNESATYLTGATQDPVELENSSHMQMRNDEEMRKALQNLFSGGNGNFFKTDPR